MASACDIFSDTEFGYALDEALREFAQYVPHIIPMPFTLEYRTGTDTAGTANYLTDTTESQFVAADATLYKVVKNTTDNTWARITSYSSTSVVGLSADIMDSGEGYTILNPGCSNHRQVNVADILADYVSIDHVEWPLGTRRNWTLSGDILELDIASDPTETDDLTVWVFVNFPHFISDLSDLAGAVNNGSGYSVGATSMAMDALQSSGTMYEGQEFTLVGSRNTYRVTANATIATNAATVYFFPGLDIAVADDAVVTFIKSSLTPITEGLVTELAAAKAALNKPTQYINDFCGEDHWSAIDALITASGTQATSALSALTSGLALIVDNRTSAETAITAATAQSTLGIADNASARSKVIDQRDEAETHIDLMAARVTQAIADIVSARSYFNTVNIGNPQQSYLQSAASELSGALNYLQAAKGYLSFDMTTVGNYVRIAASESDQARTKLAEAQAWLATDTQAVSNYISQAMAQVRVGAERLEDARTQLQAVNAKSLVAKIAQYYDTWGKTKMAMIMPRIERLASHQRGGPRFSKWESDE